MSAAGIRQSETIEEPSKWTVAGGTFATDNFFCDYQLIFLWNCQLFGLKNVSEGQIYHG